MKRYFALSIVFLCIITANLCYGTDTKQTQKQQKKVEPSEVLQIASKAKSIQIIFQSGKGYLSSITGAMEMSLNGTLKGAEPCVWIFRAVPPDYAVSGIEAIGTNGR
jgi:hypothetical protein